MGGALCFVPLRREVLLRCRMHLNFRHYCGGSGRRYGKIAAHRAYNARFRQFLA
jgi:hypothetical protein